MRIFVLLSVLWMRSCSASAITTVPSSVSLPSAASISTSSADSIISAAGTQLKIPAKKKTKVTTTTLTVTKTVKPKTTTKSRTSVSKPPKTTSTISTTTGCPGVPYSTATINGYAITLTSGCATGTATMSSSAPGSTTWTNPQGGVDSQCFDYFNIQFSNSGTSWDGQCAGYSDGTISPQPCNNGISPFTLDPLTGYLWVDNMYIANYPDPDYGYNPYLELDNFHLTFNDLPSAQSEGRSAITCSISGGLLLCQAISPYIPGREYVFSEWELDTTYNLLNLKTHSFDYYQPDFLSGINLNVINAGCTVDPANQHILNTNASFYVIVNGLPQESFLYIRGDSLIGVTTSLSQATPMTYDFQDGTFQSDAFHTLARCSSCSAAQISFVQASGGNSILCPADFNYDGYQNPIPLYCAHAGQGSFAIDNFLHALVIGPAANLTGQQYTPVQLGTGYYLPLPS